MKSFSLRRIADLNNVDEDLLPEYFHFICHHVNGQWFIKNLNFNLAAQDDTFEGVILRILDQVKSYIETAQSLEQGIHAEYFFNRRAPLIDWLKFYFSSIFMYFR
jgi:hypothetical protein